MYGYVIPNRPELKVREAELYQGVYCGLCHVLKRRYGFPARFLVNYDFTFLALLLMGKETCRLELRRCPVHPFRKRKSCASSPALELAAGESVILAYQKLRDEVADRRGLRRLGFRLLALCCRRSYRKAARELEDFDRAVARSLERLRELEALRTPEMDRAADTFAALLSEAAPGEGAEKRVYTQLFYHLGRWIYLMDALDDLEEDLAAGRYNPVALRYGLEQAGERERVREPLELTLNHSRNLMISAFHLLPEGPCSPIVWNVLTLGMELVQRSVFAGTWRTKKKKRGQPASR